MSNAEERAQAAYPAWKNGIGDEFSSHSAYYGFIEGYHQAEKDLELTLEDIKFICCTVDDIIDDEETLYDTKKEFYNDVLKRFKKYKEKTL